MLAAIKGQKKVIDVLVTHNCNLDLQGSDGSTALTAAARYGHKDVVDVLVTHNCNLDLQNDDGVTGLMLTVTRHHSNHAELATLIESTLRRSRNWAHRKVLMMVLAESKYLLASPVPLAAASSLPSPDVLTHEKVLGNVFLVQQIMSYV